MKTKSTFKQIFLIFAAATSLASVSIVIETSVQASSAQVFKRIGSSFCLNAYRPGNGSPVNLWGCDLNDPDQKWEKIPVTTGTTTQWMIKRVDSNFCLNAYRPGRSSTVNVWQCDQNDPDQKWETINNQMIRRAGSNYCLNAYRPGQASKVNLWDCDSNDPDQKWENVPLSGSPVPVDFNLPAYRENNPFWQAGYAPKSVNPPIYRMSNPNAKGNCTWYANGRLRQLSYSSSDLNRLTGDASQWANQARAAGIPTSNTPQVGSIAQWSPPKGNHVAVVEQIYGDGTIRISESSYSETSGTPWDYLYHDTRTISPGSASWPSTFILVRR